MVWLVLSSVLLAICIVALSIVTFSLARQIGVLHERSQPVASELRTVPVDEGAVLERLDIPGDHSLFTVTLLFVATGCPLCRMLHTTFSALKENHRVLGAYWVFAGDTPEAVGAYAAEHGIAVESVLVEPRLALQCAVINTPTLVLLRRDNQGWQLQARRSITSARQLQTLVGTYVVQAEKADEDYGLGVRATPNRFDDWIDRATRKIAQRSSRRRFLARFGSALVAATTFPVLPVSAVMLRVRKQQSKAIHWLATIGDIARLTVICADAVVDPSILAHRAPRFPP